MKLDLIPFEKRVEQKLISKQVLGDLAIYNYTPDVQWGKKWDKYTQMARGLILRNDGEVIARPFPKFFNLNERPETEIANLPVMKPEIMEKMDGSLGILYNDGKTWKIATRGSFISEQAVWASNWLHVRNERRDWLPNITYLFEIIYPENRIVVNYGKLEDLVLIGLIHNWTGRIHSYKEVRAEAERLELSYPRQFEMSIPEIQVKAEAHSKGDDEEGFVILYPEKQLQIKVKYKDYVKLHRLIFGISVKGIWETMSAGLSVEDAFKDAPDEVMDWIKQWKHLFREQRDFHLNEALKHLQVVKYMETRKEQALYLQKEAPGYLSIVFSMLDDREYLPAIYKKFMPSIQDRNKSYRVVPISAE